MQPYLQPMHKCTAHAHLLLSALFRRRFPMCLDDVVSWASSNRLQLNPAKTEVMWCATSRRQHQLPSSALQFSGVSVAPVKSVRDLGIHIDAALRTHVLRTISRCFGALRQLCQIRRSVPTATLQMLVVRLVLSRLDFGNSVLVGIPACLLRRLQSVLNAGARLIFQLRRSDHITDVLDSLHWLRVPERIQYKIALPQCLAPPHKARLLCRRHSLVE